MHKKPKVNLKKVLSKYRIVTKIIPNHKNQATIQE